MVELVHVRAVWGSLIYIMNTPTDDMNNIIRVGILQRPDNLCYRGQCVNTSFLRLPMGSLEGLLFFFYNYILLD